jgi:hypothetical protein
VGGGAGHNTQFADYRTAGRFSAPRGETFAPFPSSTFENIHGEQAGKRDRGGSAMGARHIVREHATTQTVLNKDIQRAARLLPLELGALKCNAMQRMS